MAKKHHIREFQRAIVRSILYSLAFFFRLFPYTVGRPVAWVVFHVVFVFLGRHKRISYENLQTAFGTEKTEKELKEIVRKCFDGFGEAATEILYFINHPHRPMIFVEEVIGKEHLDAALAKGKGVLALTAHFGNFPILMLNMVKMGYPCKCVMHRARDEKITGYLLRKRDAAGMPTIFTTPRRECVVESIRSLRNNDVLFLLFDQNFGAKGGVFVDYFGTKAATATGPIVFAQRTGAAMVPMFIVRQPNNKHKIYIEPEVQLENVEDEQKMFEVNLTKLTKILEKYVRQYPEGWTWMHRRWKTRPADVNKTEGDEDE